MFLSNRRKIWLLSCFCVLIFEGCGSSGGDGNGNVQPNTETKGPFPFSTREPGVYQGDFVITSGGPEDHCFVARKGEIWRIDYFTAGENDRSEIKTDQLYDVDRRRKIYAIMAGPTENHFDDAAKDLFTGKERYQFDEAVGDTGVIKYKMRRGEDVKDEILISVDQASGMIVREEFLSSGADKGNQASFVYEVRNLSQIVDDNLFQIPADYRKVTPNEFFAANKSK